MLALRDDLTPTNQTYYKVNYDFVPETDEDLGCSTGEILKLEKRVNDEWIRCSNSEGRIGIVPDSFVTIIEARNDFSSDPITIDSSQPPVVNPIEFLPTSDPTPVVQYKPRKPPVPPVHASKPSQPSKLPIDR